MIWTPARSGKHVAPGLSDGSNGRYANLTVRDGRCQLIDRCPRSGFDGPTRDAAGMGCDFLRQFMASIAATAYHQSIIRKSRWHGALVLGMTVIITQLASNLQRLPDEKEFTHPLRVLWRSMCSCGKIRD